MKETVTDFSCSSNMFLKMFILFLMLDFGVSKQDAETFQRYPPPWSTQDLEDIEDLESNTLGYCAEENHRCGHTERESYSGRWVYCCPGLWCSPDPKTSTDLYSITCGGAKSVSDMCWYYEYPFQRSICIRDETYPPLPVDYKRDETYDKFDDHGRKQDYKPVFKDENINE
ncbi:uncharacterized protein LOC129005346 [Macrosteles quadrilineatus]|uniref:uncharacterized protein LOC128987884 n=1 Tax=Macrosteles quadrilineatus TaxID=74068 RepID=UPI0023E0A443|nr:uncharacterized protein LOC128987884 [Macrosteles quadrilineatus]XP_054290177.1 uncharacterized protein LOC129005346 [Macrosteles quadrilineatus]